MKKNLATLTDTLFWTKALGANTPTCCQSLFHSEPFFSHSGTCYTTKVPISENQASIFNSIQGSILQSSISAENFPDKCSIRIFWKFFHPKSI
jgi:hypothetical protein